MGRYYDLPICLIYQSCCENNIAEISDEDMQYGTHEYLRPYMDVNLTGKLRDLNFRSTSGSVLSLLIKRIKPAEILSSWVAGYGYHIPLHLGKIKGIFRRNRKIPSDAICSILHFRISNIAAAAIFL